MLIPVSLHKDEPSSAWALVEMGFAKWNGDYDDVALSTKQTIMDWFKG